MAASGQFVVMDGPRTSRYDISLSLFPDITTPRARNEVSLMLNTRNVGISSSSHSRRRRDLNGM